MIDRKNKRRVTHIFIPRRSVRERQARRLKMVKNIVQNFSQRVSMSITVQDSSTSNVLGRPIVLYSAFQR